MVIRDGRLPIIHEISPYSIALPKEAVFDGSVSGLIRNIYGNRLNIDNVMERADCAILCPKNDSCNFINDFVVRTVLEGDGRSYFGVDSIETDDPLERDNYPIEFVNSLTPSGLPPHELHLKPGAIIMLIRNLNANKGLVNGTRLVVKQLHQNSIDAEVLTGEARGSRLLIPRIILSTADATMPFTIKRKQFPVRIAFAMTINKSQGQTLRRLGIYLSQPVFAHGQLYVAFSRVASLASVKIKVEDTPSQGRFRGRNETYTSNIVYPEIL